MPLPIIPIIASAMIAKKLADHQKRLAELEADRQQQKLEELRKEVAEMEARKAAANDNQDD